MFDLSIFNFIYNKKYMNNEVSECVSIIVFLIHKHARHYTGFSLEGDFREKVSLSWLTSPYFELREKFKCIEHIGNPKSGLNLLPKILTISPNFSLKALG